MTNIFYHADDFGVSLEESESILECFKHGKMNSVSLIVNSPDAENCYRLIEDHINHEEIRCALHLNFVEGHCATENGAVRLPHLVDSAGCFNRSFLSLLAGSLGPGSSELKKELKEEICAQLHRYASITGKKELSIDSHQHYHMIPLVWKALWEVIEAEEFQIQYLRIPVDPIAPLFKTHLLFKVPFINYIKWILLWICKKHCLKHNDSRIMIPIFFGIPFTCRMETTVVDKMIGSYISIAHQKNADLELMFHPGAIRDPDKLLDKENPQLVDFYRSEFRDKEKKTLIS